jgi:hypothetical protein
MTRANPPSFLIVPEWSPARQIDESSVYIPVPQMEPTLSAH